MGSEGWVVFKWQKRGKEHSRQSEYFSQNHSDGSNVLIRKLRKVQSDLSIERNREKRKKGGCIHFLLLQDTNLAAKNNTYLLSQGLRGLTGFSAQGLTRVKLQS